MNISPNDSSIDVFALSLFRSCLILCCYIFQISLAYSWYKVDLSNGQINLIPTIEELYTNSILIQTETRLIHERYTNCPVLISVYNSPKPRQSTVTPRYSKSINYRVCANFRACLPVSWLGWVPGIADCLRSACPGFNQLNQGRQTAGNGQSVGSHLKQSPYKLRGTPNKIGQELTGRMSIQSSEDFLLVNHSVRGGTQLNVLNCLV